MKAKLRDVPGRFVDLIVKLVSTKGLVFVVATVLLFLGKIGWWEWLAAAGLVVGGRFFEKWTIGAGQSEVLVGPPSVRGSLDVPSSTDSIGGLG